MTSVKSRITAILVLVALPLLAFSSIPASAQTVDPDMSLLSSGQQVPPTPQITTITFERNCARIQWANIKNPIIAEYRIYRAENRDPQNTLKTLAEIRRDKSTPSTINYWDCTLEPSRQYTYFMTTKDSFGNESGNSKLIHFITPPADAFTKPRK